MHLFGFIIRMKFQVCQVSVVISMYHSLLKQDNWREMLPTRMNCKASRWRIFHSYNRAVWTAVWSKYLQMHCPLYTVFLFLLNRKAPTQCSAPSCSSFASFGASEKFCSQWRAQDKRSQRVSDWRLSVKQEKQTPCDRGAQFNSPSIGPRHDKYFEISQGIWPVIFFPVFPSVYMCVY